MPLWMVRAGSNGEREQLALDNNLVVVGWNEVPDLASAATREGVREIVRASYPDSSDNAVTNWTGQLWTFRGRIQVGDLVALPLKRHASVAFGRVTGPYRYRSDLPADARHTRTVDWIQTDVPRTAIDQDLLYSLGAFLTVCRIERNDAENRILALLSGKKPPTPQMSGGNEDVDDAPVDLEAYGLDLIRQRIGQRFAGHEFEALVAHVLEAQGFTVERTEAGADGGVDIVAGRGPMGFEPPRIAVQVKSSHAPEGESAIRELQGVLKRFGATQGLFVSWGGYKTSVLKRVRELFFEVRLWDADDVIRAVLTHYDQLPDDVRAELPVKRVWTLVQDEQ
jgi:restriction system protein